MKKLLKPFEYFPIGTKLVIIISVFAILSLGTLTFLVTVISTADVRLQAEYNNFTINRQAGLLAHESFKAIQSSVLFYLNMTERFTAGRSRAMEREFFDHNGNIAAIAYSSVFIPNDSFLLSGDFSEQTLRNYLFSEAVNAGRSDTTVFFNASPIFSHSLICLVFNRGNQTVRVLFSPDNLADSFGTGPNTNFLVTNAGELLLHPDNDLVLKGTNISSLPIVAIMQEEGGSSGMQISYTDDNGQRFFGAYYGLDGTDAALITTIPHAVVFEAVRRTTFQNIFLTFAVLFLAILFIWFFSKTISTPARTLAAAAMQIESGNFDIELHPKSNDELGQLTKSFAKMTSALKIFGRFTNKDIAVKAMRGNIKPGGLKKHATIFFSDIRNFTEKTENFTAVFGEEASGRIVSWLNQYFAAMIQCVEKTNGIVDKFIGDGLMAHWGTAATAGSPEADAYNGVKAALMMRESLVHLNLHREKKDSGNPQIHIGCGINTGMVTAGQLGSEQRLEYTVVGDPVNLASRTESLNKAMGTDILITENTWAMVKDEFITEEMPEVNVKGRKNPVRIFAVINEKGAPGPQTLPELRKLLETDSDASKKAANNAGK
ncbi:MAG: HAMP domain-containing protein [Treponema sp.]|nr:HAMP domain-containing protein [Treponema sp.]